MAEVTTPPIRQKSANGEPKPSAFMRGCRRCGASFLALVPGRTGERGIWTQDRIGALAWFCSQECRDA